MHEKSGLSIQSRERLIHQKRGWLGYEHASESYALAHALRQFGWVRMTKVFETDNREHRCYSSLALGPGNAANLERKCNILRCGSPT